MESGESLDNPCDGGGHEEESSKLCVKRAAYRRFSRWMDRQLAQLVHRWAHLAAPNAQRLTRTAPRRSNI